MEKIVISVSIIALTVNSYSYTCCRLGKRCPADHTRDRFLLAFRSVRKEPLSCLRTNPPRGPLLWRPGHQCPPAYVSRQVPETNVCMVYKDLISQNSKLMVCTFSNCCGRTVWSANKSLLISWPSAACWSSSAAKRLFPSSALLSSLVSVLFA